MNAQKIFVQKAEKRKRGVGRESCMGNCEGGYTTVALKISNSLFQG